MPWDRFTGACVKVAFDGSLYEASVFEITEWEVISTSTSGGTPDLTNHLHITLMDNVPSVKVAIIVKWNAARTDVDNPGEHGLAVGKLYLDCPDDQEATWKRIFANFGGLTAPPQYGGRLSIKRSNPVVGETIIEVGGGGSLTVPVATLNLKSIPAVQQLVLPVGPHYSEVATLQDGRGSTWTDKWEDVHIRIMGKDRHFAGDAFHLDEVVSASLGKFSWSAPAMQSGG